MKIRAHPPRDLVPSIEALGFAGVGLALALPMCVELLAGASVTTTTAVLWAVGTALGFGAFLIERWFVPHEAHDEEPVRLTMGAAGFVTLIGALLSLFAITYSVVIRP